MKWFSIVVIGTFLFMAIPAISGENQASNQGVSSSDTEDIEVKDLKFILKELPEIEQTEEVESEVKSDDEKFDGKEILQEIEKLMSDGEKVDKEIEKLNKLIESHEKKVNSNEKDIEKAINSDNVDKSDQPVQQVVEDNVLDKSEITSEKELDGEISGEA